MNKSIHPFLYSLFLALGLWCGYYFFSAPSGTRRNNTLTELLQLIDRAYVDSVNTSRITSEAAEALIERLDPHSAYIEAEDVKISMDELEGSFEGIGIVLTMIDDTAYIKEVIRNGPAYKAGLLPGDQLLVINDTQVSGVNSTQEKAAHIIRHSPRPDIRMKVLSRYGDGVKTITVQRQRIERPSVSQAVKLNESTGYLKVNRFARETANEFRTQLKKLTKQEIETLVIDLRDNPGGFLQAAVEIADELVAGSPLLISTRGKLNGVTDYRASRKGLFEVGKLYVLVNENSASASELLSAALQDLDRGTIVGNNTFGKGLVQEPFVLSDGSMIRLTVARYYSPSGRCIQKPYVNGDKQAYYDRRDSIFRDTAKPFYTSKGKVVYGGSGVQPDLEVVKEARKHPEEHHYRLRQMMRDERYREFSQELRQGDALKAERLLTALLMQYFGEGSKALIFRIYDLEGHDNYEDRNYLNGDPYIQKALQAR